MLYCTYYAVHTTLYILYFTQIIYILMYIVHSRFCNTGSPVSVYSLHPGGVSTNLGKNIPQILPEQVTSALAAAFSWVAKVTITEKFNSPSIHILKFGNVILSVHFQVQILIGLLRQSQLPND